ALPEVKYLGHIIGGGCIKVDPEKVKPVLDIQPPKNITDVRRFLGMTGYYRVFIPSYAQLALPLFELLKGAAKHKVLERDAWTPERQAAFEKLKYALELNC